MALYKLLWARRAISQSSHDVVYLGSHVLLTSRATHPLVICRHASHCLHEENDMYHGDSWEKVVRFMIGNMIALET